MSCVLFVLYIFTVYKLPWAWCFLVVERQDRNLMEINKIVDECVLLCA